MYNIKILICPTWWGLLRFTLDIKLFLLAMALEQLAHENFFSIA